MKMIPLSMKETLGAAFEGRLSLCINCEFADFARTILQRRNCCPAVVVGALWPCCYPPWGGALYCCCRVFCEQRRTTAPNFCTRTASIVNVMSRAIRTENGTVRTLRQLIAVVVGSSQKLSVVYNTAAGDERDRGP